MSRDLPARPNLEHLKKQAKDLVQSGAAARLADAQLLVAREYGFASWTKLKLHVESLSADPVEALVAAVRADNIGRVKRLLADHKDLRARLNDDLPGLHFGSTVLMPAVENQSTEMIDVLLGSGANIDVKTHWWAGGFGLIETADAKIVPFLLERGITMTINGAAKLGRMDDVERLVRDDPSAVHTRSGDGQTPLHVAANVDVARFLVDHGAGVEVLDVDHESTPAQYAIRERQDVARFLVERGCRTDILMAAALGDVGRVRAFLDADPASVETTVDAQYFPMTNPRAGGSIYIWTLGANKSAHAIAREFGHEDVVRLLLSRTRDAFKLGVACELGDRAAFDALLTAHPNIASTLTDTDRRKLVAVAEGNNTQAVSMMLAAGWPPDARGAHQASALHWAGFHGNAEMARELLRHSPPLELEDPQFRGTPLAWTLYGSLNGWHRERGDYPATAAAMIDAGAKRPNGETLNAAEPVMEVLRRRGIV